MAGSRPTVGRPRGPLGRARLPLLLLVVLGVLPIVGLGLFAFRIGSQSVRELVESNNEASAKLTAALVGAELRRRLDDARGFTNAPGLSALLARQDDPAVRERLRVFVESRPRVVRAFVTDPAGLLWSDFPEAPESLGKSFAHRDWYEGVSRDWSPYVAEVYRRHADPKPLVVAIAAPVRDAEGQVVGTFVHQLRLEGLTALTREVRVGTDGFVFVVDHTGTVVAHPELDLQREIYKHYADTPVARAAEGNGASTVQYVDPVSDRAMLATAEPIRVGTHTWGVVAQQPTAAAYAPIDMLGWNITAAGALLLLAASVVMLTLGRAYRRSSRLNDELAARNARLAELTGRLEALNHELESFSYSVSHDLRAPLRSLDGFSQALLEDHAEALDERGRDYAGRIRAAAQRMSKLIDDLLELSRLGRAQLRTRSVDVSSLAAAAAQELRSSEPDRRATVDIEDGIAMEGDPDLLRLVVDNLVGNAWKFTRHASDPRIEVAALDRDGERGFVVRDNGAGFDPRYAGKLFGPFQRLHRADEYPGTGIGLATVQRIASRHGGRVWAEGAPGEGAAFYVALPVSPRNREDT